MKPEFIFDCDDRSFFADRLSELTGKSRNYWTFVPIQKLKFLYKRYAIHGKKGDVKTYETVTQRKHFEEYQKRTA